jgi:hypothetical protein
MWIYITSENGITIAWDYFPNPTADQLVQHLRACPSFFGIHIRLY